MKPRSLKNRLLLLISLSFFACKNDVAYEKNGKKVEDSTLQLQQDITKLASNQGVAGIMSVPEMLVLCKLDSAPANNVAAKMSHDFSVLDQDLQEIGSETDGPQGLIYYTNNAANFKFECVHVIKSIPVKVPKNSKVVALEAGKMLIYNYYGPYETTYKAYEDIKRYCSSHGLEQSGPMREFYPAVSLKTDTSKKLTRILLPVK